MPRFPNIVTPILLLWTAAWSVAGTPESITTFFTKSCLECHDAESKKGGLDLSVQSWDIDAPQNFAKWVRVFDQVDKGEMPPKKKEQPSPEDKQHFLAGLKKELLAADDKRIAANGRTGLRRLNRVEYERTLQDLLGITTSLASLLPADTPMHGFDTVAEGLRLSTLQMEKYLEAADIAVEAAIELGPKPAILDGKQRWQMKEEKDVRKHLDMAEGTITNPADPKSGHRHLLRELPDAVVYFDTNYPSAQIHQLGQHPEGIFKIRVSAYGYQSKGESVAMRVYGDNYKDKQLVGWFDMPADQPRVVEMTGRLRANEHLRIEPTNTGTDDKGQNIYAIKAKDFTGAGLAIQWVEVEGPIMEDAWPPRSMTQLFGDTPIEKLDENRKNKDKRVAYELKPGDPKISAQQVLERFAAKAFRRPLEAGEADRFVALTTGALDEGLSYLDAMRIGFRAVLTAPQFLFLEEMPGKLGDPAVASRLSYFLWSSAPDDELLTLAAEKKLAQPEVLRAQVERLLKSEKSKAFVQNFTGQWLDLRNIDATSPDKKLYPEADELLKISMVAETEAFFTEMLKHNLPIVDVIDSDFAMLNSRLAAHYEIPGVDGETMRKVSLPPDSPRGGILTQASILKVTANGTTTSPVLRGAWVMKKLLGQHPPPPPPGVGSIEPDTRGATTVREQLAKHRSAESCAGCHANIDPPGFALESFDVIGGFRDRYRSQEKGDTFQVKNTRNKRQYVKLGLPVDASGELADGGHFAGIKEFKKLLLNQPEQVVRALAEKLATYATGAPVGFSDRTAIEAMVKKTQDQGGGLRTLVLELVQSPMFLSK